MFSPVNPPFDLVVQVASAFTTSPRWFSKTQFSADMGGLYGAVYNVWCNGESATPVEPFQFLLPVVLLETVAASALPLLLRLQQRHDARIAAPPTTKGREELRTKKLTETIA